MRVNKLILILLLFGGSVYGQTFNSTVTIQKDLRVQQETILGGVNKPVVGDMFIFYDTIYAPNIYGTGTLLSLNGSGYIELTTGVGAGGVTGLVPTEVLFGKADGTIDQSADFIFDDAAKELKVLNNGSLITYNAALTAQAQYAFNAITMSDAANSIDITTTYLSLMDATGAISLKKQSGGTPYDYNFPNANGINGQALRLNAGLNLEWFTPSTGTVTSIATTSPIGGGTITTTGTLNLLGSAADRMLYTTGVNTWAEAVSTSFGRSLMDDADAAAGLATLSIPTTANQILFGDGTDITSSAVLTFDAGTELFSLNKFAIDGLNGWITEYEGNPLTNGLLPIGRTSDGVLKLGTITSSDLTVGYSDPDITLTYAAGSILNADINGSAAIDATKINTGVVSNAEFNYVDGVTSSIQTQLDNKGYVLTLTGTQNTVADATNYYTGAIPAGTGTTADRNRVYLPMGGTITACYISFYNSGTLATGESSTFAIRYDNTTDVTVSTAVVNNATQTVASNTGLSQAVSQGHYIEGKFTTATWATNPTNIRWTVTIFIRSN